MEQLHPIKFSVKQIRRPRTLPEKSAGNGKNRLTGFKQSGISTVKIRTGIVLADKGGALDRMLPAVKMGIGSALWQRPTIYSMDTY